MANDNTKTQTFLTPAQAAQRAGCGRTRVSNALREGDLRGVRDNRGRWQIDPSDVDAWTATWRATVSNSDASLSKKQPDDTVTTLYVEISAARAEISGLRDRIADKDREIERLHAALQSALAHRPSIFSRLFK